MVSCACIIRSPNGAKKVIIHQSEDVGPLDFVLGKHGLSCHNMWFRGQNGLLCQYLGFNAWDLQHGEPCNRRIPNLAKTFIIHECGYWGHLVSHEVKRVFLGPK